MPKTNHYYPTTGSAQLQAFVPGETPILLRFCQSTTGIGDLQQYFPGRTRRPERPTYERFS